MNENALVPHVTVAAVMEVDQRFLLVRERVEGRIVYNQPAGHLEPGESLVEAVVRETLEETGWELAPTDLVGVYRWDAPGTDDTFIRAAFTGVSVRHHAERDLDAEILEAVWLSVDELTKLRDQWRSPMVMRVVEDYLAGRRYPLDLLSNVT